MGAGSWPGARRPRYQHGAAVAVLLGCCLVRGAAAFELFRREGRGKKADAHRRAGTTMGRQLEQKLAQSGPGTQMAVLRSDVRREPHRAEALPKALGSGAQHGQTVGDAPLPPPPWAAGHPHGGNSLPWVARHPALGSGPMASHGWVPRALARALPVASVVAAHPAITTKGAEGKISVERAADAEEDRHSSSAVGDAIVAVGLGGLITALFLMGISILFQGGRSANTAQQDSRRSSKFAPQQGGVRRPGEGLAIRQTVAAAPTTKAVPGRRLVRFSTSGSATQG